MRLDEVSGQIYDKKDFDHNDPEVLIDGYGRLLLSQIKQRIKTMLQGMSEMPVDQIAQELNSGTLQKFIQAVQDVEKELNTPQMKRKITMRNK